MALFITSSITWGGKENLDYFLKPMFIGKQPWETQGVRVIPNIQSSQQLNYFGAASKLLKAYAKGFTGASGTTYTQRTITTYRLKAEAADDALEFYQTVFEQGLRTDDWNDLDETMLKDIIIQIYRNAVASDVYRKFWLDDPYKETVSSGTQTGTADADYNSITDGGMWYKLKANAATSPSSTQIKRVAVSDGAIAQVDTVTLTGASGTCNVTVEGVAYLATFDTSIAVTSAAFVALHAAALLLRGIVLTGATTLIFTASVAGTEHLPAAASAAVTGDLTGTTANTTANTAPTALAAGESEDIFNSLHVGADKVLKTLPANQKILLVADLVFENYMTYLESLGTERAQILLEGGMSLYQYRGIPILPMGWDVHLDADFAHVSGELYAQPHRVIYTSIDNLVLGLDSMNQFNETKMWYNPDAEENRFRSKLVMGCQYVHNKLVAIAY